MKTGSTELTVLRAVRFSSGTGGPTGVADGDDGIWEACVVIGLA